MSTRYQMWLNYDNDRRKFRFPVLPENIKVTIKGVTTSIDIDQLGEILHKGKRNAKVISFSSYFPAKFDSTCSVRKSEFKSPFECNHWIISLMNAARPAHFVLTGAPMALNFYAIVTSYTPTEDGGDPGTISYSLELKEYRTVTVRKIINPNVTPQIVDIIKDVAKPIGSSESGTYTVVYGDCLWNIAKKFYGNGAEYTKILEANREALDEDARKHGYSSSNDGNILFAGIKLIIPK